MSPAHSRRNFLKFAPGAIALFSIAQTALAQNPPQGGATTNPTSARPSGSGGGGGGFGGGGKPPGPAGHDGDFQPGQPDGMHKHEKVEVPRKPRKDLAADQKSMREDVQQLVRNTQELQKAMEGFGAKQPLSEEMIGKTKEIERLAHDIAELAKG
jgi:hypothetical protein